MKISPLAQGTGVPAQSETTGRTASPDRMARAKAIALGQEPPQSSGDMQVDRAQASIKKIKMRTQASTNRHEAPLEEMAENVELVKAETLESPTPDVNEPAKESEETRPISPQFAALAKAKRALQVKESELAKREEALKTQNPAGNGDYISKADLLANPMKVFEAGVTYDQLTEAILSTQNAPLDSNKLRAEIKEDLLKELTGQFSTRDQQAETQVLEDIGREVVQTVKAQPEQFEAVAKANAYEDVKALIHRTWKQTGEILDVTEALELVENQLIEEALPFAQLKKVQSRLTPQQEQQVEKIPTAPKPNTKIMRTLTNRDNASQVMDRRQRAIMAMQGTLRKG